MNDRQEAQLGSEAALVLENRAYQAAMASLRADVNRQWLDAPVRDKEGQQLLLIAAKMVEKLDATMRGLLEAGKLAQSKIDINELRDESGARKALRRIL